jgi:Bacterial protein of unknown function (DUF885)
VSEAVDRLCHEYLDLTYLASPTTATLYGEHGFDDHLDDLTEDNLDLYAAELRSLAERLRALPGPGGDGQGRAEAPGHDGAGARAGQGGSVAGPPGGARRDRADGIAGPEDEADRDALVAQIVGKVMAHEQERPWRRNPFTAAALVPGSLLYLVSRDFAPLEARMRSAASRLEAVPRFLEQAKRLLDEPCPRLWRGMAVGAAGSAATFVGTRLPELAVGTAVAGRVAEAASRAAGALRGFATWLTDEHAARFPDDAPFALGEAAQAARLREVHCFDDDPATFLALGSDQLALISGELTEHARRLGSDDWAVKLDQVKAQHPDADGLLAAYAAELSRLEQFVFEHDLAADPEAKAEVIATPEYLRGFMGFAAYSPSGPFDPHQQGYFYVTPPPDPSGLRDHSFAAIPAISAHEGYPGHHLQMTSVNRLRSVTRRALRSSLMIEGWGLYTEQLMHEVGYYTPEARLAQLAMRLLRALRIVLDMELHSGAISYEDAVAKAMRVARLSEPTARSEVARYTMTPTQPFTYLVGALELERLRASVESRLGLTFRHRDFHDRVLAYGHMPPALVRRAIEAADDAELGERDA